MKPSKPISTFRLSSLLRLQKDPTLALQLFQNPNSNPTKPFRYSLLSYDLIITKLGRAKMFDKMEQILQQLNQETRFSPTEIIFCNVISFYARARLPDCALQTFFRIPDFRCHRTVKSLNSLLDALSKCGEFHKVREMFLGIHKYGTPDACTYNILIKACCRSGSFDDACNVFDEMRRKGVCPNVVTFGTLIYQLCLNFKLKEAFKLKEYMVKVYGVKPNVFVYTSMIKGLCGIGELSLAFSLKEEMVRNKLKLDSAVYSTLISVLFEVERKEEAFGLLEEMKDVGCKPDTVTYNVMINGFCKEKNFEAAFRILDEIVAKGYKPDVISYNVIIGSLCKEGKWSEARDLLEDMPRRGIPPDVVSYRTLFDGLCDWMQFKEAAFVLDEMIFKGFVPRHASINMLVDGLCQEGNMELLLTVLDSLGKGNNIGVDTWKMAIFMVCKKDKLSNSSNVIDTLVMP
ncbi:putative pentatricopeptide repeat-containing protein At1g53330 [Fagus crenata]